MEKEQLKLNGNYLDIAACMRKKPYTKRGAKDVMRKMEKENGIKYRAYSCQVCGTFHITKLRNFKRRQENIENNERGLK